MNISNLFELISGLALFLFGMSVMGDGLKKLSGSKLEPILFKLSGTPLRGILLGTGVTAVIQSSSATSVMVVGFVNSGMMKVKQGIPVILGAILGTSITGWIVCLNYINTGSELKGLLSTATLTAIVALVGIIFRMFSKNQGRRYLGDIMMGFSVLMIGMSSMSGAMGALGSTPLFTKILTSISNPILGILVGVLLAALLQSASAAVGVVQALSLTGSMTFSAALPLLMGICIGASLPVLLTAIGAENKGQQTAYSYLVASILGVVVAASLFYIANAIFAFSFTANIMNPFTLAFINTVLRLAMLCLLAPFVDVLEAISAFFVRTKPEENEEMLHLEERFLSHPALAVEQSRQAICDMAKQAETAIHTATALISSYNKEGFQKVAQLESASDHYEDALGTYLSKLTGTEMTAGQNQSVSLFLHSLTDFERISDHALNIAQSAKELDEKQVHFTEDAMHELSVVCSAVSEILSLTVDAFCADGEALARRVEPLEEVIDSLTEKMKRNHIKRVQAGKCTVSLGFVYNDLATNFERISDHCSNIAVALIEEYTGAFDTHELLGSIKEERDENFERYYQAYKTKYSLSSVSQPAK